MCANTGNDSNTGSESSPLKTIQCAANRSKPGTTILVQPGIYRERVSPPVGGTSALPIVYKSAVPQQAIIRGSVPWRPDNQTDPLKNIYSGVLLDSDFTDTSGVDGPNPFKIRASVSPYGRNGYPESMFPDTKAKSDPNIIYNLGQVFVNDIMYKQCPYKTEMETESNTWYYDISNNELFVNLHDTISNCTIEITNQRRLFAPHTRGLRYIVVDGFIIERCGNNYPNKFWVIKENQQAGAVGTRTGSFWTIQNNIIRYANTIGIDWGTEGGKSQDLEIGQNGNPSSSYGHVICNNIISDNGAAGTASYMGKNITFCKNTVERNNNLYFYGKYRWESAGVKVHCPTNMVCSENIIRNNFCHGIWCDQGAGINAVIKYNVIQDNSGNGINYEIGTNMSGNVLHNVFTGNYLNVAFVNSGGCLLSYNLFLDSKIADINTTNSVRNEDKWDSLNVQIYNNLFMYSPMYLQLTEPSAVSSRYMNNNKYAISDESSDKRFKLTKQDKTKLDYGWNEWIDLWKKLNNGKNCDQSSTPWICHDASTDSLTTFDVLKIHDLSIDNVKDQIVGFMDKIFPFP